MERRGELLESGIFGENYYGTPKPPKEPKKLNSIPQRSNSMDDRLSDSSYKKEQSRTNNHQTDGALGRHKAQVELSKSYHEALHADSLGPLPSNWEIAFTEDNEKYFIK